MFDDFAFADFEQARRFFWHDAGADAAWVANGDGAGVVVGHRPQHVAEFVFVFGLHVDEVWDVAEVADVKEAVVRGAVVAAESAAIHTQADGEILQRDIVNDHVVGALHEGGVNREEWREAFAREAGGEKRGVFLGDADVEIAVGVIFCEGDEAGAAGHRTGDGDELVVRVCKLRERLTEQFGVGRRRGALGCTGLRLEAAKPVKFQWLFECGRIAFTFDGLDVEDDWLVLFF